MNCVYFIERKPWEPRHPPLYIKPLYRSPDGATRFDLLSPDLVWNPAPGLEQERAAGTIDLRRIRDREAREILVALHPTLKGKQVAATIPYERQGWSGTVVCPKCGRRAKSDWLDPNEFDTRLTGRRDGYLKAILGFMLVMLAPFTPYRCPACGVIRWGDCDRSVRSWLVFRGLLLFLGILGVIFGLLALLFSRLLPPNP